MHRSQFASTLSSFLINHKKKLNCYYSLSICDLLGPQRMHLCECPFQKLECQIFFVWKCQIPLFGCWNFLNLRWKKWKYSWVEECGLRSCGKLKIIANTLSVKTSNQRRSRVWEARCDESCGRSCCNGGRIMLRWGLMRKHCFRRRHSPSWFLWWRMCWNKFGWGQRGGTSGSKWWAKKGKKLIRCCHKSLSRATNGGRRNGGRKLENLIC